MLRRRFSSGEGEFNPDKYLTIEALEDGLSVTSALIIYYRTIEGKWTVLTQNTPTPQINKGECLYIKAKWESRNDTNAVFKISKGCKLKGNCMSLLFLDSADRNYDLSAYPLAFYRLFEYCTTIKEVSSSFLPATTLADYCYHSMFYGCINLTTAPELPATTLGDYCYSYMFHGCTSLTTAPSILPATRLKEYCYRSMFYGCTQLNYIKMLATDISASNCLDSWVSGVASTGTFVKNPAMTSLPIGTSGIPSGWTVVNDVEQSGGGGKIVNKLSYSIGRLDRITFTFQYPVESDVAIYFLINPMEETYNPITITKGENTITKTTDAYITNNSITLTRIVPNEDNTYIYTW